MKNRIRELRDNKKMTLDDLSKATGIKRGTLNNYELGKTEPKLETWKKLADYFGFTVPYLQGFYLTDQERKKIVSDFFWGVYVKQDKYIFLQDIPVNEFFYIDSETQSLIDNGDLDPQVYNFKNSFNDYMSLKYPDSFLEFTKRKKELGLTDHLTTLLWHKLFSKIGDSLVDYLVDEDSTFSLNFENFTQNTVLLGTRYLNDMFENERGKTRNNSKEKELHNLYLTQLDIPLSIINDYITNYFYKSEDLNKEAISSEINKISDALKKYRNEINDLPDKK